ncbi:Sensor histidine kinase TodS [compost metagenome]
MKAIKETEQFKSRFLTNISHEFRTPLTLINGHLELLKQLDDGKNSARYLEMENNGKRLLQLINQLLDLSKMESGQCKLRFSGGNILDEIRAHVQTFHSYADQLGVGLTMEIATPEKTPDRFFYSQEALATILANLLSNALKFTPPGGNVHMHVKMNVDLLLIEVSDTGSGIPEQQLDKVFDRFYQVDENNDRFYSGSGIGLALVKELTALHGGDVSVKNVPEGGCVFTVSLANRKESGEGTEFSPEPGKHLPEQVDSVQNTDESIPLNEELPLILVVEDQEQLRRFVCECLGVNYRYLEAPDGFRGLELAKESLPDLIISDVMMPGMNGIEFCSQLKNNELTSHIPVVLLTAKAEQSDKEIGLETGADDYLVKPFSISELKLRVRNMLRLRQQLRDKLAESPVAVTDALSGLNERDREFLQKLSERTTENISNTQFGVNPLAESVHLSSSQLTRKLKALTGNTPADFIRNIRLQKGLELLQNGMSITDVSWEVGFEDPSYFAKVFKKQFGVPPSETEKLKSN